MKFSELEDAGTVTERLERIERDLRELRTEMVGWVRWIIGLQLGSYLLIIGSYFLKR
jgi:hypothetical protein